MRCYFLFVFIILLGCASESNPTSTESTILTMNQPFENCEQLVVVTSPNDTLVTGILRKYTKKNNQWIPYQSPHPITLGRTGLRWGSGIHEQEAEVYKQEGDGKSPAGIFSFGKAFGYAPEKKVTNLKLDYIPLTEITQCIEDTQSKYYNQIVSDSAIEKDWDSSDFMRRDDHLYKWGVFVNHNIPAQNKDGSCIFFHLWREPGKYTLGCTGMEEAKIVELIEWLDPTKQPRLVQMTEQDYGIYRKKYDLP